MDCSEVFFFLFVVHVICFVNVQASTHMPPLQEPTLAPEIVKALEHKFISEECRQEILDNAFGVLRIAQRLTDYFGRPIPPCNECQYDESMRYFNVDYALVAKLNEKESLMQVMVGFTELRLRCYRCFLTDDAGNKVDGDISVSCTKPRMKMTMTRLTPELEVDFVRYYRDLGNITVNLFEDTANNRNNTKVECIGTPLFVSICKKTHASGELDHVMRAGMENLFTTDNQLNGGFVEITRERIEDTFQCDMQFLNDMIPVEY